VDSAAILGAGSPPDPLALDTETQALDRIQHATRLQALTALKPRERQALYLKGLGYTYHEIGQAASHPTA
jgi:DNA-directed RNA polymerase specialized sigma24 family protein